MCKIKKARIAYIGPALDAGTMPVKELAPALLSFAELVENCYKAIGGQDKIKVMLNQDSLRKEAFDITFLLDIDFLKEVKLLMASAKESGLDDLMTVLGWGTTVAGIAGGVIALIKKIRGRKIKRIEHKPDAVVEITLEDDETVKTTEDTLKVFLSFDCRLSLEHVLKPLKSEGVEAFELRDPEDSENKTPVVVVSREESSEFKTPPAAADEDAETESGEQIMLARIVSLNFEDGKWRLSDGTNTFWASIEDEDFLSRIDRGETSFTKGDTLRIQYRLKQTVKGGKLATEYIVSKVLEQRKAPKQIKLDFEDTAKEKEEKG